MAVLKHPRIPNVEVDVPESDVASWVAQGWVSGEPVVTFDNGGVLEEGLNVVKNDLGRPEPLVRPKRRK